MLKGKMQKIMAALVLVGFMGSASLSIIAEASPQHHDYEQEQRIYRQQEEQRLQHHRERQNRHHHSDYEYHENQQAGEGS